MPRDDMTPEEAKAFIERDDSLRFAEYVTARIDSITPLYQVVRTNALHCAPPGSVTPRLVDIMFAATDCFRAWREHGYIPLFWRQGTAILCDVDYDMLAFRSAPGMNCPRKSVTEVCFVPVGLVLDPCAYVKQLKPEILELLHDAIERHILDKDTGATHTEHGYPIEQAIADLERDIVTVKAFSL